MGILELHLGTKGQQPTVKTSGKRKGYKVFGLIDFGSGRLFWKGQTDRCNADSYMAFLADVLTQTQQHLLLIQDGARYHTSKAMQDFFAAHADRLTRYQLPSYSPDFNPIEYLWRNVKKDATHLKYFADFAELKQKVDKTLQQLATLPDAILGLMGPTANRSARKSSRSPKLYRYYYRTGRRPTTGACPGFPARGGLLPRQSTPHELLGDARRGMAYRQWYGRERRQAVQGALLRPRMR